MKLTLTEEQEMLKKAARDFLADKCPKAFVKEMEESETGHSRELWQEMVELGWTGLAFPEKYGGGDMNFLDLAVLLEEMGRAPNWEAAMSKAYSTAFEQKLASAAMEVVGPYGQLIGDSKLAPVRGLAAHSYLGSKGYSLQAGTSEILKNILATRGLGLPSS